MCGLLLVCGLPACSAEDGDGDDGPTQSGLPPGMTAGAAGGLVPGMGGAGGSMPTATAGAGGAAGQALGGMGGGGQGAAGAAGIGGAGAGAGGAAGGMGTPMDGIIDPSAITLAAVGANQTIGLDWPRIAGATG